MSISWIEVENSLRKYMEEFRRTSLPELAISGIYVLTPPADAGPPLHIVGKWPDPWPNNEKKGIYLIFGKGYELLYVGKASANSSVGARLSSYFQYNVSDKSCSIVERSDWRAWSSPPKYVLTIAVPNELSFEAPALEEYLIASLKPPDNRNAR